MNKRYAEDSIKKDFKATVRVISSKTREIKNYAFEYNSLVSEEVYLGEGMRVEEKIGSNISNLKKIKNLIDDTNLQCVLDEIIQEFVIWQH